MARTRVIRLDQAVDEITKQTEALLREAIDLADSKLKDGSPFDTGRLKASWLISENRPDGQPRPEGNYPNVVLPPQRTNYKSETLGKTYHVYNNVPYVVPVITGEDLPPSWGGRWRSKKPIVQNYHEKIVAKDVENFIKDRRIFV
jgi:hypothetical protein|tara:strand:- start:8565 stop:8999 length:435 start_codon:yes stop_codon:yes gene_type:complete